MTKDETSIKTWIQNNRGCHYWLRIPIEWYDYFKGGDFNWIAGLYKTWYDNHVWLYNFRYTISEGAITPKEISEKKEKNACRQILSNQRGSFRKVLRARRTKSFTSGMYLIRTTYPWFIPVFGKYNHAEYSSAAYSAKTRPGKGDIVMYINQDEQNQHIFMHNNLMWALPSNHLDGLSRI